MRIVLFGPPGVGKSTQADLVAQKLHFKKFSMGDILRDEVSANSELGKRIKKYVERGDLVPDDVVFELVQKFLGENKNTDILFEGYPRTVHQAEALDRLLSQFEQTIDMAVEIFLSDDEVFNRLSNRGYCPNCASIYNFTTHPPQVDSICDKCGHKLVTRSDDSEKVIRRRLNLYEEETKKLAQHYNTPHILKRIHATGNKQEVFEKIAVMINDHSKKK